MPYRKDNISAKNVSELSQLSEDLEETPVYIKAANYGIIKHKICQPTFYFEPHLIKSTEITPGTTRIEYENRRKKLFSGLPYDSCLILASNPESKFSSDGCYKYRQQSDFNYFTGLQESYCIAVFTKDSAGNCKFILFLQPIIIDEMCWHGHRCGLDAGIKYFGAHECYEYFGKDNKLFKLIDAYNRIYFDTEVNKEITSDIREILGKKKKIRFLKYKKKLQEIRLIKSESEIELIRKSVEISSISMIECMKYCEPGMLENELSIQFEYGCKIRGATRLSYQCSVASGINATNLNYFNNNSILNNGNLCLIDCGCEYNGYSSDITRTFPINGRFTNEQKELYKMVLNISNKLINTMVIGCTIKKLENLTNKLIKKGLKELGITNKLSNNQIRELKISCSDVHFVTHFIGLDIHDTSDIQQSKSFNKNMVLAIEPAIYLPNNILIPSKYRGIGIRIEDNILITNNKPQILSKLLPRTCNEIELYMKQQSIYKRITPHNLLETDPLIKIKSKSQWNERDNEAAKTLSSIRFKTKKEEKIKQQYNAIKLFQQAIYQQQQQQQSKNNKIPKNPTITNRISKSIPSKSKLKSEIDSNNDTIYYLTNNNKKKKSLYSSPIIQQQQTSQQNTISRKRKRNENKHNKNKERERERERPIKNKKTKYNNYSSHSSHSSNSSNYCFSDYLYPTFYASHTQFLINNSTINSNINNSNTSSNSNTQSAYDCFMAKSNDKNNS